MYTPKQTYKRSTYTMFQLNEIKTYPFTSIVAGVANFCPTIKWLKRCNSLDLWLRHKTWSFAGYIEHFRFGWASYRTIKFLLIVDDKDDTLIALKHHFKITYHNGSFGLLIFKQYLSKPNWTVDRQWVEPVVRYILTQTFQRLFIFLKWLFYTF